MSFSTFSELHGGGRITLPFLCRPRLTDDLPSEWLTSVIFYQMGEDDVPWTGYYTIYDGRKIAVENYQGVWFEIKQYSQEDATGSHPEFRAIRVARASLGLVHHPNENMNLIELRAQTTIHGTSHSAQPTPTGFSTAPATPFAQIFPSRPASRTSNAGSLPAFGTGLNFGRGSSSTPKAPKAPEGPPEDDPFTGLTGEQRDAEMMKIIRGDRLEGSLPVPFTGDRSDTMRFLLAFDRYTFINHNAGIIKDPLKRSALFLGLVQGKAITWANRASEWLKKVRDGKETPPFGFDVWQITEREFKDAFTDYADADRAHQDLLKLRMKEGRLDEYIAEFQDLVNRAGLDRNGPNTLRTFAQGLQGNLASTCIFQDSPENFPQWVQSAQQHHRNWLKVQSLKETSPFQQRRQGTNPFTWKRNNGNNQSQRFQQRDPNAMDVDVIRKATTDAEREKYRNEGRCFNCGKQGHLSRMCPDRKPRIAVATSTPQIAVASTSTPAPTPPVDDIKTRIRKMAEFSMTLGSEEQEFLAGELKRLGADFH
jgi:hypothetical protein